jgi:hypothetical protein
MLNIEVHEEHKHGNTYFEHSVVVEQDITSGQATDFQACLHYDNDDVIMAYAPIEPGDDIDDTGAIADHHQFRLLARRNISDWLNSLAADLFE